MGLAGDQIIGMTTVWDKQVTTGTTTSTSYTATLAGGTACGVTFVAPPTGVAVILATCQMSNTTASAYNYYSPQVRAGGTIGSGTLVLTASDDDADVWNSTTLAGRNTVAVLVAGLTAGSVYNVQGLHKVSAGTGAFTRKQLIVMPQA